MVALKPHLKLWHPMLAHAVRDGYANSGCRFNVAAAGRRSGKTEFAKRRVVSRALKFRTHSDGYFILGAPTRTQAKDIFWEDLKRRVPKAFIRKIYETDLSVHLHTGTVIRVVGCEVPQRLEGRPIDGGALDEYANMKPEVWQNHLRPALDTLGRPGWMDFTGVPEGRNHYHELFEAAAKLEDWASWTWRSADILPPAFIEAARRDMDPLLFEQEYGGSFVTFQGLAYYMWDRHVNCQSELPYDENRPLVFCFDFNISPGTATVCQESAPGLVLPNIHPDGATLCLDEVWIRDNSRTDLVCDRLINQYGDHKGPILLYGDPAGGARDTRGTDTDWDLILQRMEAAYGGRQVEMRVPSAHPSQRGRVNAMNRRLKSGPTGDDLARMYVSESGCPQLIKDFEGVTMSKSGLEIDKNNDKWRTHSSDGVGYYIAEEFPLSEATRSESFQIG